MRSNDTTNVQNARPIIYQNAVACPNMFKAQKNGNQNKIQIENFEKNGVDVFDGPDSIKIDTNPFTNTSGPSSANPFNCYLETVRGDVDVQSGDEVPGEKHFEDGSLMKGNLTVKCKPH